MCSWQQFLYPKYYIGVKGKVKYIYTMWYLIHPIELRYILLAVISEKNITMRINDL